jgi:hypothetical protein
MSHSNDNNWVRVFFDDFATDAQDVARDIW